MRTLRNHRLSRVGASLLVALIFASSTPYAWAANHSDAPLIKQDPQANLTDVYAFIGTKYNDPGQKVLNVIVHVRPFSEPGDGAIYDRFADDALYSIHITHPATGRTTMRYDFRFSRVTSGYKNLNTILSYGLGTEVGPIVNVGDARQNFTQTYTVTKTAGRVRSHDDDDNERSRHATVIGSGLLTPPPNVGKRTTPAYNNAAGMAVSGATTFAALDKYTQQTVHSLPTGEAVFAGPREDGFYCDIPGIFDLLDPRLLGPDGRGQTGNGVDGFKGFNVLAFAIQIPVASLATFPYNAAFGDLRTPLPSVGAARGVGVYASTSRPKVTIRKGAHEAKDDDDDNDDDRDVRKGREFVQVSRMGNPLFNEAFVALKDKDNLNATSPTEDDAFATYAENPELATLLNVVFGTTFATTGRADLRAVFIPEVLRVDTTTPPVTLAGQAEFNRLGFIGGDTTLDSAGRVKSSGWPNGRRLGDDVCDIGLTAVASGPTYNPVFLLGDNIAANDQIFNRVFPYSATPHSGTLNRKDP
jgi:uncharacterized protein DUF4331